MGKHLELYEIDERIRTILESTENADGELTEEQFTEIEQMQMDASDAGEMWARYMKELEYERDLVKVEVQRLALMGARREKRLRQIKERVCEQMQLAGWDHLKGPIHTLRVQNSPPQLDVKDETAIPQDYWIPQDPVLDKRRALKDLKDGKPVPGADIYRGVHLRIYLTGVAKPPVEA